MAATYIPITTTTLTSSQASVTLGSGGTLPQTYTDLVLIMNGQAGATDNPVRIQFNGDTGTNYSATNLRGTGSAVSSGRTNNNTSIYPSLSTTIGTGYDWNNIVHFMDYANTTTYKTVLSRVNNVSGGGSSGTELVAGLWRSTSAITSMVIFLDATTFSSGTTFTLYGIKAA